MTPLQLAAMISSIANDGTLFTPLIVKKIENASGETIKEFTPEIKGHLPIDSKKLDLIKKGLWDVVNGKSGTGHMAHIDGIDVSGKTGSAQVFSRKNNDSEKEESLTEQLKSHAWFVGYAPSANPQIAVAVLVEHGEHGANAAPIAREIIRTYLSENNSKSRSKIQ